MTHEHEWTHKIGGWPDEPDEVADWQCACGLRRSGFEPERHPVEELRSWEYVIDSIERAAFLETVDAALNAAAEDVLSNLSQYVRSHAALKDSRAADDIQGFIDWYRARSKERAA